jgi:hypothetical protein
MQEDPPGLSPVSVPLLMYILFLFSLLSFSCIQDNRFTQFIQSSHQNGGDTRCEIIPPFIYLLLNIMFHAPMGRFQLELNWNYLFHRRAIQ